LACVGEADPVQQFHDVVAVARQALAGTRSGSATFSNVVRWSSSRKSWNTTPMRRRSVAVAAGQGGDVAAEQRDEAAGRLERQEQQPEKRGLAGARRAGEERNDPARW
jgi:hypothetical protein